MTEIEVRAIEARYNDLIVAHLAGEPTDPLAIRWRSLCPTCWRGRDELIAVAGPANRASCVDRFHRTNR